jgi:ParB family chromosome partitioning protein
VADLPYKLELLDPAEIEIRNLRDVEPDQDLIDSVRRDWLLQPVGVLRTRDGELVLRFGQRRLKACIAAGRHVPALVVDGTTGTTQAEIDRIFLQLAENDNRKDLTAAERASAVATLFELGATTADVTRRTGYGKGEIAAARKAAGSETALTLAAQYPLTLEQLAVITEFDDSPGIATGLAETARDNPAQFTHAAQLARDEREGAAMLAARAAELASQGHTVTTERQHYENLLTYWAGPDRKQLTPETHKDCPGAVVVPYATGHSDSRRIGESWYCTDPRGNGHKKFRSGQPERNPEEASAERSMVLKNNQAWRSAATVRRQWLRDVLLQRKDLPAGADLLIARAIAAADNFFLSALSTMSGGTHKTARELLGTGKAGYEDYQRVDPLLGLLEGVSEQRAHMITLALVLGAYEEQAADPYTWRHPGQPARQYLTALAGWGYTPSAIEQGVIDAARGVAADASNDTDAAMTAGNEGQVMS